MSDLQWLAIATPIALVVLVSAIVTVEELINQAEMKRERVAAEKAPRPEYSGRMTIEFAQGDLGVHKQAQASRPPVKSHAG